MQVFSYKTLISFFCLVYFGFSSNSFPPAFPPAFSQVPEAKNLQDLSSGGAESVGVPVGVFTAGEASVAMSPGESRRIGFFKKLTRLKDVRVEGNLYLSDDFILSKSGIEVGDSIFQSSKRQIKLELESLPWIRKIRIRRSYFPPIFKILVQEEEPWMVLESGKNGESWLMARNGVLIAPLSKLGSSKLTYLASTLPRLTGLWSDSSRLAGSKSRSEHQGLREFFMKSAKLKYAVSAMKAIEASGGFPFSVSRVKVDPTGRIEVEPENPELARARKVIFAYEKKETLPEIFRRYSLVREDLSDRGKIAGKLDLRFDGQVIAVE